MSSKRTGNIETKLGRGVAAQVARGTRKKVAIDPGAIKADRIRTVIKGVVVPQPHPLGPAGTKGRKVPTGTPKA
ncbi:MAG: hypothetical protein WBA65_07495 [Rhodanobacter sp.]|jgi:hypothetical protein